MRTYFKDIKTESRLPVIIQDKDTKSIIEICFINNKILNKSFKKKLYYFLQETFLKEYPNFQVQNIFLNEKKKILLIKVSSVYQKQKSQWSKLSKRKNKFSFIKKLEKVIEKYCFYGDKKSYYCPLFQIRLKKILQKLGEETIEFIIESKDSHNNKKFLNEAADLIFHFLILLNAKGQNFDDVLKILYKREEKGNLKRKIKQFKEKVQETQLPLS